MKKYILGIIALITLLGAVFVNQSNSDLNIGGDAVTPIAGQTYTLAGSGVSSADTSITLTSFTITQTGYKIQDSDMSDVFYLTIEPGSRSRQEIVSCTTVTQNSDNTATLSGCERGLAPISPYSASTTYAFTHSGGSTVIFSNPPQLYSQAAFKANDETITGSWLFPTPLTDTNAATKAYVDAIVTGGTVSNDRLVVAGTAGETVATGTLVYFNHSDQEWYGVGVNSTSTFDDKFIGLTQSSGLNGVAINGGILLKGRATTQTGLTPGAIYYASTATGTISSTPSAQTIGVAVSSDVLYFDPIWIDVPTENGNNIWTGLNTFSETTITGHASTTVRVYTASSTWTKPAGLEYIIVEIQAGGGGGGSNPGIDDASGGGGGGGYAKKTIAAASLSSTEAVVVGVGGGASGNGGYSSFGSHASSTGGNGGAANDNGFAQGGIGVGGDINIQGASGGRGLDNASADARYGGYGGDSQLGRGAAFVRGDNNGLNGLLYGGGGGGASGPLDPGSGAQGVVIVTEYY
jgi:hypothetical protein